MIDKFDRKINYLRISVTDRCNLRCTYCMPPEGIKLIKHEDVLTFEEIYEFTKKAVAMGISKVRLTGGEPLVRKNIVQLVSMLGKIDGIKDYAMTTNAIHLKKLAQKLRDAGLHRLNISLDSVNPEKYKEITYGGNLYDVFEGIETAVNAGFKKIKINCVIKENSKEKNAVEVAKFSKKHNFEIRYIRQMNIANGTFWQVEGGSGGLCSKCNRLRLSSNGNIYPCLFNDIFFNVRELGVEGALQQAVQLKPESGTKSENNKFYGLGG